MALHLPNWVKTLSGLEPVLRSEPSTYQLINSKLVVFVGERGGCIGLTHTQPGKNTLGWSQY